MPGSLPDALWLVPALPLAGFVLNGAVALTRPTAKRTVSVIGVGVHYENSEYSRDRFVYDLERLCGQTHPVSTLWDPSDPRGE